MEWAHNPGLSLGARRVALVGALMVPCVAMGQGMQAGEASVAAETGEPATTIGRIDAAPGTTVLLPLIPAGARLDAIHGPPEGWVPAGVPGVTIAGRGLEAGVHRLEGRRRWDLASDAWLPVPHEWTATSLREFDGGEGEADVAFWVLSVRLPERPIARHLEVGARRVPIHWLEAPPERTDVARLPLLEAPLESRRRLGDLLRREAIDPFRRWRCAIIADRFTAHALWGNRPALEPLEDPVLEAAARHAELRARAAVEAARRIDPDLGGRLLSALTTVVRMPSDDLLPAWVSDESGTLELFSALLDPGRSARKKREDVEVWLSRVPRAVAWVVSDDVGERRGVAEGRTAIVGIANLTDRQALCSAAPEGRTATNAVALLPHRCAFLRTELEPSGTGLSSGVVARLGTEAYPLRVVAASLTASPPGIDLGPLLPDWSMSTWLGAGVPRATPGDAATARLFAAPASPDHHGSRAWKLFVEARWGRGSDRAEDAIRVWCGPTGQPWGVIEVSASGDGSIETGAGREELPVEVSTSEEGWRALLTLPGWLIPESGVLWVGVERVDGRRMRSAWPRPMMPGQGEPGRLRIDLGGWSPVEGR